MRSLFPKDSEEQTILQVIYRFEFLGHRNLHKQAREIYDMLAEEMDLSRPEVKLLAHLSEGLGAKDIQNCRKVMNLPATEVMGMLNKLIADGLVNIRPLFCVEGEEAIYTLSGNFREEIRKIKALRNMTERQLQSRVERFAWELRRGDGNVEMRCRKMERMIRLNPFLQFSKGYVEIEASSFPLYEKCALFLMAGTFIHQGMKPLNYERVEEEDTVEEPLSSSSLKEGIIGLMRRGLVSLVPDEGYNEIRNSSNKKLYLLSEKGCKAFFKGMAYLIEYSSLSKNADVIRCCDIEAKELFFDVSADGQLEMLKTVIAPERYARFVDNLHKQGMAGAITVLFHGAPGTGKTELARQLARESGRDIFVADVAKLYGAYWGETEKSMRELFRGFRYLNVLSAKAPILLFNEADGIIGKRMENIRSNEKSENAIQTIILQELEVFEGIFIATTNLASNMDDAFDRRFLIKVEFRNPSPQTAAKIWRARIPELSPEDALYIASRFPFSGGKIDNVAKKRMLFQAANDMELSLQEMMELCRNEELKSEGEQKYFRHFQIVRSNSIRQCELFYDENVLPTIDTIRKMVISDRFNEVIASLKQEGLSGSVNILLHGTPGTGKTELAMQLARESGRDLYIVDASKLHDGIVGSGERNIRELFAKFRHLNSTAERAPILLFNEADGIIGKRLQVERSSDKDENAMQSVLLQELENFEGIFIATTNLICNVDAAFDRRFLFKVELSKPSPLTAAKIWRVRIPELTYAEALALAKEFTFSGGQIDNIAKRRAICKAVNQRTPTEEEMRQYCLDEQFKAREGNRAVNPTKGFTQYMNN